MQCDLVVRTAPSALYWCGNVDLRERDDVYYYILWRLKLEGETENMGVCTKERKGVMMFREMVGFNENTAMRHRWGG